MKFAPKHKEHKEHNENKEHTEEKNSIQEQEKDHAKERKEHKELKEHKEQEESVLDSLTWKDLESTYPRYPRIQDIRLTPREENATIDLRTLYNPTPYDTVSRQKKIRFPAIFFLPKLLISPVKNRK